MAIYNTAMTLACICLGIYTYFRRQWIEDFALAQFILYAVFFALLLLNTVTLAWSVVVIRRLLKSLDNTFTNENFIGIHLINSCVYMFLLFIITVIEIVEVRNTSKLKSSPNHELEVFQEKILFADWITYTVILTFQIYYDMFLLYLV